MKFNSFCFWVGEEAPDGGIVQTIASPWHAGACDMCHKQHICCPECEEKYQGYCMEECRELDLALLKAWQKPVRWRRVKSVCPAFAFPQGKRRGNKFSQIAIGKMDTNPGLSSE
jgi:hypothetical protein